MFQRNISLKKMLDQNSYFLFGPRTTGKSFWIKHELPGYPVFDLLNDDTYEQLQRRPGALGEKIRPHEKKVIIDEIQKLPKLLDEVHRLIENRGIHFLLTGSSVRSLKRRGTNLLGGRARESFMFPLTYPEISSEGEFDLIRYLNYGGLPRIYLSQDPIEDLKAYGRTYLSEEIKKEAEVRNYDRFVRFMETMALTNGQELNYANISSDSGVPARTLEGYIEVLKDTLIGFELLPYQKTLKRKANTKSKFFFFDCGVANYFSQKLPLPENSVDLGNSFEQFIIQEVRAYLSYQRMDQNLYYWRSKKLEVDLVIDRIFSVEIKYSKKFHPDFTKGLKAFREEGRVSRYFVVGRFEEEGIHEGIEYLNYKTFLKRLWSHLYVQK